MSENKAIQLAKLARRAGLDARMETGPAAAAACGLHSPNAHPMCGKAAVIVVGAAGPYAACRYIWCAADIGNPQPAM
jgi:hypothetical protein